MATMSFDSSTTHMTESIRRGSVQIEHTSASVTFPHISQNRTFSFTRSSAEARALTSSGSSAKTWKAMRCALFGPTPGNRPSSSMSS